MDAWQEEFQKVPDKAGQLSLYFGDTLEDRSFTLEDAERQAKQNADRIEREQGELFAGS